MKYIPILTSVALVALAGSLAAQNDSREKIESAKQSISEWVQTRQLISKEQSEWREQKQLITHRIELFREEIAVLEAQIEEAESDASQAEQERARLDAQADVLREAARIVDGTVTSYENKIKTLSEYFPRPLKSRVAGLIAKMPKNPQRTSLTTGERMAVVMGILNEVDKFNGNITLESELREIEGGRTAEVSTLYVGLATAYYVDANGEFAGVGFPAQGGWTWTEANEFAPQIARTVAIYNGSVVPAEYVPIPITITNIK